MERTYLSSFIQKNYPQDFQIIGEARDGSEVLELSEKMQADLYLLDIHMPKLDGLETAEQLRERQPHASILFITSYAEFAYVKKALQLGVVDYLLKPYDDAELQEAMEKILDTLNTQQSNISLSKEEGEATQLTFLKHHQFLDKILLDNENWHNPHALLLYQRGRLDAYKSVILFPCSKAIASDKLLQIIRGIFCKRNLHALLSVRGEEVLLFLFGDRIRDFQELETSIQRARSFLRDETGMEIFSGLSSFYTDTHSLLEAYEEASSFLLQIAPPSLVARFDENQKGYEQRYLREKQIVHAISAHKDQELPSLINEYLDTENNKDPDRYLLFLIHMTRAEILGNEAEAEKAFLCDLSSLEKFEGSTSQDFLHSVAFDVAQALGEGGAYHNVHLVRKTIRFIQQHYKDKITLQEIADTLEVSYSHLSKCFKRVAGTSFNAFLLETRMEEAIHLFSSTPLSIAEVGKQVGIDDPYYFSKSFKKYSGVSPREFVAMHALSRENS
ncbi:MAG: response regulator [Sphaerochaetaceae bacterium]|nr:response regulator [uncultured Sphaerochaeta sp.]MDC7230189.1 response regulator [Sphaerochaetaceae bacterium]